MNAAAKPFFTVGSARIQRTLKFLTRIFHTPAAGADAQAIFVGFGKSRSRKGRSAHTTPLPPCGSDQKTPRFSESLLPA